MSVRLVLQEGLREKDKVLRVQYDANEIKKYQARI